MCWIPRMPTSCGDKILSLFLPVTLVLSNHISSLSSNQVAETQIPQPVLLKLLMAFLWDTELESLSKFDAIFNPSAQVVTDSPICSMRLFSITLSFSIQKWRQGLLYIRIKSAFHFSDVKESQNMYCRCLEALEGHWHCGGDPAQQKYKAGDQTAQYRGHNEEVDNSPKFYNFMQN